MMRLADEGHPLSFRKVIWLWTKLCRRTGFRRQEFAMESRSVIQVYVKPNGKHVVRAFTMKDIILYLVVNTFDGMQKTFGLFWFYLTVLLMTVDLLDSLMLEFKTKLPKFEYTKIQTTEEK